MGELRFPGLATGIDTAAIIKQLMIVNSRRLAKYQIEKNGYNEQITGLGVLRSKVNALKSAAGSLSDIDDLEVFSATSSDTSVLTLNASSEASPGSHSVLVNQLATTETWIQDVSTFEYKTDYVLTDDTNGVFIYSYNNQETTITAVKNETTLEDFVNLINNDEGNPGVTASLLNQGGKYHLMLNGQETGEDYQISVNASSTEVWSGDIAFTLKSDSSQNASLTTKITELTQFGSTDLGGGEEIRITGTDRSAGAIDPDPFTLSVTSNTTLAHLLDAIEEAFDDNVKATLEDGVIVVTDTTSGASQLSISFQAFFDNGSGATLTLPTMAFSTEGGATTESLASLVSTSFVQTQAAQNSEIKVDGYPAQAGGTAEVQTLTKSNEATAGSFTLTYDGQTTGAIAFDATVREIQDALELLSNVNPGDIGVSDNKLKDAGITAFAFRENAGDVSLISINTINLTPSAGWSITETTKGTSENSWITGNSNTITDILTGVTLNLQDVANAGEPVEITISRNTRLVVGKVNNMVAAYNALINELKSKTEYNTETKKMGILSHDIAISLLKSQVRNPFIGVTDGFVGSIDTYIQGLDIGITIDGAGLMQFDSDEFNDAINEDYINVLELLGATKSGNSSSSIIQFYGASDKYTTAGTYDIEVDINDSNQITEIRIKLSTESSFRNNSTWSNNLITGIDTFDDNGNPIYPENGLQLTVDLTQDEGTYTATVNVKQGAAGSLEDILDEILEAGGRLDVSEDVLDDRVTSMTRRIENEENRLNGVETRLIAKFARLEKTLSMMQKQMAAVTALYATSFG